MATKHGVFEIAEFKALPDEDSSRGRFSAIVSVFGNTDLGGDRVVEGAFAKSLDRWRASGDPIPVIWSHDWGNPNAHIGAADPNEVKETEAGLQVDGSLDLDNPFAAQVYRLLKERRVKEMSFGYMVNEEKPGEDGANELLEVDILEVGPTLKGMNPDTQLLGVKADLEQAAAQFKAGRAISKANESKLRGAVEAITQVLASLGDADEGKSDEADDAKAEAEGVPASDPDLLSLQRQINALRS